MYNFLDSRLLPKVSSDSVALDSYEVSNLISDNFLVKSRGFIAYTSIKPPIDIDFETLCPVSLLYISLSTKVGTQKTTGIEILARTANSPYTSICQAIFNEPGVVFCNSRFYSKHSRPENVNSNFHLGFFKANAFRTFTNTTYVRVRILRTEKSVPCIAAIEIWGRIAKTCSTVTVNTVHKLLKEKNVQVHEKKSSGDTCTVVEEFEIPDDFKDALTYELMALPMTLPSGHTVDQSTVEKCLSNNALYGRDGSDPFTGLKFTNTRKPILNVPLKARIDTFLVLNANRPETFNLKRTLGKVSETKSNKSLTYYDEGELHSKKVKINTEISESESLEQALNKVLSSNSFMRFTNFDQRPCGLTKTCNICFSSDNMYKLPCEHVCCRQCLLEMTIHLECKTCKCKFKKSEPIKFHL